jgi:antitoxin component YwqK of YwqJK toxin-antitoxin module
MANCLPMNKYISLAGALLFCLIVCAQQESILHSSGITTKSYAVIRVSSPQKLLYQIPAKGLLQEFHEGKLLFSTASRHSKLNGGWQSWYAAGHLCDSGKLVSNLPDGEWKFWGHNGRLKAIRTYDAEKFNRVYEEIHRYNPKRSFYFIAALSQKNIKEALWYLTSVYSLSGKKDRQHFSSLRQQVQSNITVGNSYQPVFSECLHEGLYMNFFENGQVKDSGYYKDGIRNGKWIHYEAPAGNRWEGAYHNGQKIKEWKYYNKEGGLTEIVTYHQGQINWRKTFMK